MIYEVDTEEEMEMRRSGMPSTSRMASDPVLYGHRDESDKWLARRGYQAAHSDEEESDEEESATLVLLDEREEALYHSASQRIKEARQQGRKEVKLSKKELEVYEKRSKMMAAMNRRQAKPAADKKKPREERVTVPIGNLDVPEPVSRKNKRRVSDDALPKHITPGELTDYEDDSLRPTSRYYPPAAPGVGSRRVFERSPSPMAHDGASSREPTPDRRVSDNALGYPVSQSSYGAAEYDDPWVPTIAPESSSSRSRSGADPFQYQTAGPRAPYPSDSPPPGSRRSLASADRHASDYSSRRGIGDFPEDESEDAASGDEAYMDEHARETRSRTRDRERDRDRDRPSARSSGLADADKNSSSSTSRRKRSPLKRKTTLPSGGTTSGSTSRSSRTKR
jgi:hypothetical protein